ncbi:MAG: hypothetical protein LQ352_001884 [Teloschistes flavicans]|nr:MAG: hypothetical protein LQ352_001884 [Teloschistes flavicans]
MASPSAFDTHSADQKVKTLVNTQLKSILKREKLAVSGLKAAMQNRLISQLHHYAATHDLDRLNRLKGMINNPEALQALAPLAPLHQAPYTNVSLNVGRQPAPPPIIATGSSVPGIMMILGLANSYSDYLKARLMFKDSPFYTVLQALTPVQECKALVREATRDHVDSKIIFRSDIAEKFTLDPDLRVMIFCASEPVSQYSKLDVAFPHQVEIKVNMDEVKANLRGLKNKPGSTRPADITTLLRKRANYENSMSLTYALTHKKFYFVANLVKRHPVGELVNKLKAGKIISQEQVIKEMIGKAQDNDVQATGANMSLKCPLSTLRIDVPCRSTICMHNQCFDASSFLQLQEQAPTWTCPVCNKIVSFEALEIDQYVDNILKSTPRSVEQVTVEPDGHWSPIAEAASITRRERDSSSDDEDLVEIKDPPRLTAVKNEFMNGASFMRTPSTSSREQSSSSVPPPSVGAKRSTSTVIDLVSDDDDEENPRPSKRPSIPPYPVTPTYSSDHIRPQMERGNSSFFRSYPVSRSSESSHSQRGYPHPP